MNKKTLRIEDIVNAQYKSLSKIKEFNELRILNERVDSPSLQKLLNYKLREIERTIIFPTALCFTVPMIEEFKGEIKIGVIEIEKT